MSLLVASVLFIAAAVYVAYPLLAELRPGNVEEETELDRLLNEKDEVVSSLKDLEMDYRMGKLTSGDYSQLKLDLERRAALVFEKLEKSGQVVWD